MLCTPCSVQALGALPEPSREVSRGAFWWTGHLQIQVQFIYSISINYIIYNVNYIYCICTSIWNWHIQLTMLIISICQVECRNSSSNPSRSPLAIYTSYVFFHVFPLNLQKFWWFWVARWSVVGTASTAIPSTAPGWGMRRRNWPWHSRAWSWGCCWPSTGWSPETAGWRRNSRNGSWGDKWPAFAGRPQRNPMEPMEVMEIMELMETMETMVLWVLWVLWLRDMGTKLWSLHSGIGASWSCHAMLDIFMSLHPEMWRFQTCQVWISRHSKRWWNGFVKKQDLQMMPPYISLLPSTLRSVRSSMESSIFTIWMRDSASREFRNPLPASGLTRRMPWTSWRLWISMHGQSCRKVFKHRPLLKSWRRFDDFSRLREMGLRLLRLCRS